MTDRTHVAGTCRIHMNIRNNKYIMIKKILLAVAMMLPMFGASAQSTLKIGLVNTNEIIQAMPETADAQKKLAENSKKYEDEYAKLQEEFKRMYDDFNNMPETELPAIKERKAKELQDYQTKIQSFLQSAEQDMQRQQAELMAPISQKIKDAVESVGKEGGYSLIENYTPDLHLFYTAPVSDITPQVKAKLGLK